MLNRIGLYPPGTLVRLANHETACVTRAPQGGSLHWVVSVLDAREHALDPPLLRDVGDRRHAIIGSAQWEWDWPAINWIAVWGY